MTHSGSVPARLADGRSKKPVSVRFRRQWPVLLMLLPALILIFTFSTVPLVGLYMAFTRYKVQDGIFGSHFVGLENFVRFFTISGDLGHLLRNTLVVNILSLVTITVLSLAFSIFLKELSFKPFAKAVQTASFFPYFISWVITYAVVWSLFSVNSGAINIILKQLGLTKKGINLLGREEYSWGLTVGLANWKRLGYNAMLYLSAMGGISQDLYEAAAIDGAGRFRRIWHVTIPGIMPTVSILLIMAVGSILNSGVDFYFVFQNATNWRTMEMFDMYTYKYGMQLGDYSYATAVGIMKSAVSIMLLLIANRTAKVLSGSSIF